MPGPDAQRPLQRLLFRTILWYLGAAGVWWVVGRYADTSWGVLMGDAVVPVLTGRRPDGDIAPPPASGSTLPTMIAMFAAFVTALPVTWIYTHTRGKKGYQQSVVQTLLILPVIVSGIVVLVKHSLSLAFALGGIVAAVRFRTALDDSKDAANVLVVTGIGLAAAVEPPAAFAISVCYNLLILALWQTDFGRAPNLEGKQAEQRLEKALQNANRTGTFVARLDDQLLADMAPDQLEALADRAWRRRKRNAPEAGAEDRPEFSHMLRVRSRDADAARGACELHFDRLFVRWKYMGRVKEGDGVRVLEYGVTLAEDVTPGVVSDRLTSLPAAAVTAVELRR